MELPGYGLILVLLVYTPFLYTLLANFLSTARPIDAIDHSVPPLPTTATLVASVGQLGNIVLEVPDRGRPRKPRIVRFIVKVDHPEELREGGEKPLLDWLSATLALKTPVFILWDTRLAVAKLPSPFVCWYFGKPSYRVPKTPFRTTTYVQASTRQPPPTTDQARTTYGWMETQQTNGLDIGSVFAGAAYLMPQNAFGKLATSVVNMASTLSGCTGYVITYDDATALEFLTSERDELMAARAKR